MEKLNFMGIGPKIGSITLPWLVAAIVLTLKFKTTFAYFREDNKVLLFAGIALLFIGLSMYFLTALLLLKGLKRTLLITTGTYYLCCNPLYSSILVFVIPGISFLMNSWLILTTSIAGFVLFKAFIKREYAELEKFFGDEFRKYRAETPALFPLPLKKWIKSARRLPASSNLH